MNYCKNCKKVYEENIENCKYCSIPLVKNIKSTDCHEVFLINCSGFDKDLITGVLNDNNLSFSVKPSKVEKYAPEMKRNNLTSYDIFVPYSELEKARETLNGINKDADYQNIDLQNQQDSQKTETDSDKNIMGGSMLWRIVSVILFLMLISLVVFGTDYIISLIKSFF